MVAGDFNVAPTDDDVWDPKVFVGSTHVTPPEREALAAIRELGLTDIVARPLKGDRPFTYWDYRAGMFHQNKGMRIDLVYATAGRRGGGQGRGGGPGGPQGQGTLRSRADRGRHRLVTGGVSRPAAGSGHT